MKIQTKTLIKSLPIILVILVALIIVLMIYNRPEPRSRPQFDKPLFVDVIALEHTDYQVVISSYGNIQAATSGNLVAQVSGIITEVSPNFASGLAFKKGELLLKIDDRDYQIEVTIAQAELANTKLALEQELALAEQAKKDWLKINPKKKASSLVLRKPQVASAKARLDAAQARLDKAKLALERTQVRAPYNGKIIKKLSDLGQLVNQNTPVASIFSVNSLEARLPISSNRIQFLPKINSRASEEQSTEVNKLNDNVILSADFGGLRKEWLAQLDRADSVVDQSTRQWFVTAKIDPDILNQEQFLKVGQFVNADILGKTLKNVFIVPSKLVSQNNEVYLFYEGTLKRKVVSVVWQTEELAVINSGLEVGQQLITTPLNFVADGTKVKIKNSEISKRRDIKNKEKPPNENLRTERGTNK